MRNLYLLFCLFCVGAFSQNVTITKIIETGCSNPFVKTVELYVDGTVDFANDNVVLNYMQNGDPWADNEIDISNLGVQTDAFVYIVRDIPLMQAEFPSTTFDSSNTVVVGTSTNGDDGYQIVLNGIVVSQFGQTETDGTGEAWEHSDAVATRKDGIPDTGTFDISHWDITEEDSTETETACDGGNGLEAYFNSLGDTFPLGSGSGWTPACETFISLENVSCNSEGVDMNDDTYTATLNFFGANNGNAFTITTTAGNVGGDDPSSFDTDTITVSNIPEGTDISLSVSDINDGGVCDLSQDILSPGCVPLVLNEALYDPASGDDGDANNDGTRDPLDDEFIEFFNNSDENLDISGYTIFDSNGLSSDTPRHIIPDNTIIPANGAYVVFGGGAPTGNFGSAIVEIASSGQLNLTNGGDVITVKNSSGDNVIIFDSDEFAFDFGDNQSITRSPDIIGDYMLHTDANANLIFSPGLRVDGTTLSVKDIVVSQDFKVYPNPVSDRNIFIQTPSTLDNVVLYNLNGKKVFSITDYQSEEPINLDGLSEGVYILSININQTKISKKIIID